MLKAEEKEILDFETEVSIQRQIEGERVRLTLILILILLFFGVSLYTSRIYESNFEDTIF